MRFKKLVEGYFKELKENNINLIESGSNKGKWNYEDIGRDGVASSYTKNNKKIKFEVIGDKWVASGINNLRIVIPDKYSMAFDEGDKGKMTKYAELLFRERPELI